MAERHIPGRGADKEFQQGDPLELRGVVFPADGETSRAMARCFVEEYALLGFSRRQVARLFRNPLYAGTYALAVRHGEAFVDALLDEVFGPEGGSHA